MKIVARTIRRAMAPDCFTHLRSMIFMVILPMVVGNIYGQQPGYINDGQQIYESGIYNITPAPLDSQFYHATDLIFDENAFYCSSQLGIGRIDEDSSTLKKVVDIALDSGSRLRVTPACFIAFTKGKINFIKRSSKPIVSCMNSGDYQIDDIACSDTLIAVLSSRQQTNEQISKIEIYNASIFPPELKAQKKLKRYCDSMAFSGTKIALAGESLEIFDFYQNQISSCGFLLHREYSADDPKENNPTTTHTISNLRIQNNLIFCFNLDASSGEKMLQCYDLSTGNKEFETDADFCYNQFIDYRLCENFIFLLCQTQNTKSVGYSMTVYKFRDHTGAKSYPWEKWYAQGQYVGVGSAPRWAINKKFIYFIDGNYLRRLRVDLLRSAAAKSKM